MNMMLSWHARLACSPHTLFWPPRAAIRSDDDVDLVVALDDFVSPQAVSAIAGAAAGLDVEFPPVPRAHDLQIVGVAHAAVGLVGPDVLFDPMDQQPLANRTAL